MKLEELGSTLERVLGSLRSGPRLIATIVVDSRINSHAPVAYALKFLTEMDLAAKCGKPARYALTKKGLEVLDGDSAS